MIRFTSLYLHNFALYPDAHLDLSTDQSRPVTLIRGENESGKTTLMRAFLWVLYGEEGLPDVPNVMHPIRPVWAGSERMRTRVELRFEATGSRGIMTSYKLIREATTKVVNGLVEYDDEGANLLFKQLDGNWGEADTFQFEMLMHRYFRPELRDFFFIDADKSVRFVGGPEGEHDDTLMRSTTTQAIYSLLGMDALRRSIGRLENHRDEFIRKAGRASRNVSERQIAADLEKLQQDKDEKEGLQAQLQRQVEEAEAGFKEAERRLHRDIAKVTAQTGLHERISKIKDELSTLRERRAEKISKLNSLIEGDDRVAAALMLPAVEAVVGVLDPLYRAGKIPPTELTLLPRLLREGVCVCGIRFEDHPERRDEVERRYHESERLDRSAQFLGSVLEDARRLGNHALGRGVRAWTEEVKECQDELAELDVKINDQDSDRERLESQRDAAGTLSEPLYRERQSHVNELRGLYEKYADDFRATSAEVEGLRTQVRSLGERLRVAQTGEQRSRDLRDAADVADDLQTVLRAALDVIESRQVRELSNVMNRIFRDVIGATAESNFSEVGLRPVQSGIGSRVQYEPYSLDGDGKDKPLAMANGASRRALAVSFVLALAETTGSSVPFVADSLLHPFAGGVLRRLVSYLVDGRRVGQPILFGHTHDFSDQEIRQLLIDASGQAYTITSEAHVGGDVLRAAPHRQHARQSVICDCGIDEYCDICEHTGYASDARLTRRAESRVYG
jgi:DNA sulfur modification protein DndD